jgi:cell division protein FtsQ
VSTAAVVVDPRMRSRRIEVRRDAGRRRLRRALAALSVVTSLVAAAAAVRSPLLDVDHVRATAGEHTSARTIVAAAGIGRGDPMVGLDAGAVERRVESLPWVADARVDQRWPGTVRIAVEERTAAAAVTVGESRWAEIDRSGRVLAFADSAPAGLPTLSGVGGRIAEGEPLPVGTGGALALVGALAEALPGGVAQVSTDLEATLIYGAVVRFGSADDLDAKVTALETVLARVELACLSSLDLSAPRSPALTRHEGCS